MRDIYFWFSLVGWVMAGILLPCVLVAKWRTRHARNSSYKRIEDQDG